MKPREILFQSVPTIALSFSLYFSQIIITAFILVSTYLRMTLLIAIFKLKKLNFNFLKFDLDIK